MYILVTNPKHCLIQTLKNPDVFDKFQESGSENFIILIRFLSYRCLDPDTNFPSFLYDFLSNISG